MAQENSYKLIEQMNADSYEAEMMKDPDFRADRERAEHLYNQEQGIVPPAPSTPDMER
jgi:hypothetical protein